MGVSEWSEETERVLRDFLSHYSCREVSYCPDDSSLAIILYEERADSLNSISRSRLSMLQSQLNQALSCTSAIYAAW